MDRPASIIIRCQSCDSQFTPRQLAKAEAQCHVCRDPKWHIRAEFDIVEESDSGNVGMNLLGIGLLAATGSGFTVTGGSKEKSVGKSLADVYDITGEELRPLCKPIKLAYDQIAVFVIEKEKAIQRERMHERGASHCKMCNILFVPSEDKPWTLAGTCSKSCCAAQHGSSSYVDVEEKISQETKKVSGKLKNFKKESRRIETKCICGHEFSVPKMYEGTMRKCPQCETKTLIPNNS